MAHIRRIMRTSVPLLLLAILIANGAAAHAKRVVPNDGAGTPITDQAQQQQGSPLWLFLLVAAGSVLLTLLALQSVSHLRASARRHGTADA